METTSKKKNLVPMVLGYVLGLAGLYVAVRVASTAWRGGQK
jgi:hypothetical protein